MTDNEIIKALERLSAEDPDGFSADIWDLICRRDAEIETKNKEIFRLLGQVAEVEKKFNSAIDKISQVRIAAYKDFADMVKDTFFLDISEATPKEAKFPCALMYAIEKEIDKALKEMVGEDE